MHSLHLVLALFSQAAITAAVPLRPLRVVEIDERAIGDLDAIERALAPVSESLNNLDAAILSLDGGPVTANNLLIFSQQAQVATDQATVEIQSANDLGAFRAARLRRTTDGLIDQTTTTVSDLVSRKPILDSLGVSGVALESLQRQKISTMALTAALEERVPRVAVGVPIPAPAPQPAPAVGAPPAVAPAPGPAPVPNVPAAPMPVPVPPPQVTPPTGRKDRKKKKKAANAINLDVEREDSTAEAAFEPIEQ
ncbi:cell wall protein [Colletotrichum tofieldiae]|nr:cell wall protein [Colletotrichum tofieldiae]GKT70359.1 cell wall protein [Colletotrichum tofieldiae]